MSFKKNGKHGVSLRKKKYFQEVNTQLACLCAGGTRQAPVALESVTVAAVWSLPSWLVGENLTLNGTTFFLIR